MGRYGPRRRRRRSWRRSGSSSASGTGSRKRRGCERSMSTPKGAGEPARRSAGSGLFVVLGAACVRMDPARVGGAALIRNTCMARMHAGRSDRALEQSPQGTRHLLLSAAEAVCIESWSLPSATCLPPPPRRPPSRLSVCRGCMRINSWGLTVCPHRARCRARRGPQRRRLQCQ